MLATSENVAANNRTVINQHASAKNAIDHLYGQVLLCYVANCFADQQMLKVQIYVSTVGKLLHQQLCLR